jgi:hypothetical protein
MALLTQDILLLLNEADPMGLIKSGSPRDEYLPEAKAIEGRLATMSSIDDTRHLVHGVFVDWFSNELAGEPARYAELAERIYTLKSEQHANSFDSGDFIEWKLKTFDSLSPRNYTPSCNCVSKYFQLNKIAFTRTLIIRTLKPFI